MSPALSAAFCLRVQKTQRRFSLNTLHITQRRGVPPSIYAIVTGIVNLSANDFCLIEYHREQIALGFLSWIRVNHHRHQSEIILTLPSSHRLRSNIRLITIPLKEALQQLFREQMGFSIDYQLDNNPIIDYYTGRFSPLEVLNVLSTKFNFDFLFDMSGAQIILSLFKKGGFRYQTLLDRNIEPISQDHYHISKMCPVYLSMSYQSKPINRVYLSVSMSGRSAWQYSFSTQKAVLSNICHDLIGYTGLQLAQVNQAHQIQLGSHRIKTLYRSVYQHSDDQTLPPIVGSSQYLSPCADDFLPLHYGAVSLAPLNNRAVHYQLGKQTFSLNKQSMMVNTMSMNLKAAAVRLEVKHSLEWQSAKRVTIHAKKTMMNANSTILIQCGQSSIILSQGIITLKAMNLCIN